MAEKLLLLNSGGFDSVTLAYRLRQIYPDAEITALFFDYGQRNVEIEKKCADRCAARINATLLHEPLRKFHWTHGHFYDGTADTKGQYLEYRNLIFLSYAVSIAEAAGCTKIFMATHYFPNHTGMKDTDIDFIDNFNKVIAPSGIEVVTPFAWVYKNDLASIAEEFGLKNGVDFFSCNNPTKDNKPCGKCADCKVLEEMGF